MVPWVSPYEPASSKVSPGSLGWSWGPWATRNWAWLPSSRSYPWMRKSAAMGSSPWSGLMSSLCPE
jgi:hypothetical protein